MKQLSCPVAVVGLSCRYPDAANPRQLWENILSRRRQFRQIPDCRLPVGDYYNADPEAPDMTYGRQAAVIDGFDFDWAFRRIPFSTYTCADIVHWLALEVAIDAVTDAGFDLKNIPGDKTGVIVGNSLAGEQSRAGTMRLRWPFVRRAFRAAALERGLSENQIVQIEERFGGLYKSVFPKTTEDTLAGGLANTIAGRICNYLDLNGGGYVVDGACSSSLIAVATAACKLAVGELDMALAGGVDISLDSFELIGFSKTKALTDNEMNVYDRKGDGFIPGEGCGFVVLKRLEDALRDKDEIYSVIQGWGISSDGGGQGITAPSDTGQALSIQNAYKRAPYSVRDLFFVEGHGTGTSVGDKIELQAVSLAFSQDDTADFPVSDIRPCGITSLKSIIGHTKAASGVGGFIKTVMAVNQRVLPPTAGCTEPHPVFNTKAVHLYPIISGEVLDQDTRMRAGVSSMGFGGINCHITMESAGVPSPKLKPEMDEMALMATTQQTEVFVWSAHDRTALVQKLDQALETVRGVSYGELTDYAALTAKEADAALPVKAALIAGSPDALLEQLQIVKKQLLDHDGESGLVTDLVRQVYFSEGQKDKKIGLLFPGQGSQQVNMGRGLIRRFPWARDLFADADQWVQDAGGETIADFTQRPVERFKTDTDLDELAGRLALTENAQPAICLNSLLWFEWLKRLGIRAHAVGGHSLGELSAVYAAGGMPAETLIRLAAVRGKAMRPKEEMGGGMVTLFAGLDDVQKVLEQVDGYLIIANVNSPRQIVLSGDKTAIDQAVGLCVEQDIKTVRLKVSNAFHSRLAAPASDILKQEECINIPLQTPAAHLFSSTTGEELKPGLALDDHFSEQVVQPVDFVTMVKAMAKECDVFIEVGPGRVLSGLAADILGPEGPACLPLASKPFLDRDVNAVLAHLFVLGVDIQWENLYDHRLVRPFVSPADRKFIENPCEKPFDTAFEDVVPVPSPSAADTYLASLIPGLSNDDLATYLKNRGGFLADVIRSDIKYAHSGGGTGLSPVVQQPALPLALPEEPAVTEAPEAVSNVSAVLFSLIAEVTGFPAESLSLEMRLLDDLNLDSIKAGDIIAKTVRKTGVDAIPDTVDLGNASLAEIVALLEPSPATAGAASRQSAKKDVRAVLFSLISEVTGFPVDSLSADMRLLDDLNLDSIKAGDIIAKTTREIGTLLSPDAMDLASVSLAEIIALLETSDAPDTVPEPVQNVRAVLFANAVAVTGYPEETLEQELLLKKDLNISVEKLQRIIQDTARDVGGELPLDLEPLLNRTFSQIAGILERIVGADQVEVVESVGIDPDSWVREFETVLVEKAYEPPPVFQRQRQEDNWENSHVLILAASEEEGLAESVRKAFGREGARVTMGRPDQWHEDLISYSHILMVLPIRLGDEKGGHEQQLKERLKVLSKVTAIPPAASAPRRRTTLGFIQFGGGFFGQKEKVGRYETCGISSLAASLHLERSDLRVRVIDFSPTLEEDWIADRIIEEVATPEAFSRAGFDHSKIRRVALQRLLEPAAYQPRKIDWSEEDVILVTGGAKGITRSCVRALASETGVRLALVGRSPLPDDLENPDKGSPAEALKMFEEYGISARYYVCDVADGKAVAEMVREVAKEQGPVTGVVHGAGLNFPKPAAQVLADMAFGEISPKVLGALNLLDALNNAPLKMFAAMTSIIGVTGMPGNAWYGFSNEVLDMIVRQYGKKRGFASVSLAYSIWRDEGMGARLGSVTQLKKMGVDAIPTPEGVKRFVRLFLHDPGTGQVIVTARLKGLDTWQPESFEAFQGMRYLDEEISSSPGVESVFKTHLTLDTDPYLKDHDFNGSFLFPTVFGLEAMAQAVTHVCGALLPSRVKVQDISLLKPISVDAKDGCPIIITAVKEEKKQPGDPVVVHASVARADTGAGSPHFSARFILGLPDTDTPEVAVPETGAPLALDPVLDLYRSDLLFQGKAFQRIETVLDISRGDGAMGETVFKAGLATGANAAGEAFPDQEHQHLVLGDPFFRDALLQSALLLVPEKTCLPVVIDELDMYPTSITAGHDETVSVTAVTRMTAKTDDEIEYDVVCADAQGKCLEQLQTYRVKVLKGKEGLPEIKDLKSPAERDTGIVTRILEDACTRFSLDIPMFSLDAVPGIHEKDKEERHSLEQPLIRMLLEQVFGSETHKSVTWTESGRPVIDGEEEHTISLSHDDRILLGVIGQGRQGCDLAPVTPRSRDQWVALLGKRGAAFLDPLMNALESGHPDTLDQAGTRIWALLETLKKSEAGSGAAMEILEHHQGQVLFRAVAGDRETLVLTMDVDLTWGPERIAALTVTQVSREKEVVDPYMVDYMNLFNMDHVGMNLDGPQGQGIFYQCFHVGFRPSAQLSRTVYFSNYCFWLGEVREASVWPVLKTLGDEFTSGKFGQVTNDTHLYILGEATVKDRIEVQLWASGNGGPADSTMELTYDFRKIRPDGSHERVAKCIQNTTWVEVIGHGLVKPKPYPGYYWDFMENPNVLLLPQNDLPNRLEPLDEPMTALADQCESAPLVYKAPDGPSVVPVIHEQAIETSLDNSNLVGNVYFANYFSWQGQTRDRYFYNLVPECFRGTGEMGELICLESRVDHLREAMPFDSIRVTMALKRLTAVSAEFFFEYFKAEADGSRTKLAFGMQKTAWVVRDENGRPSLAPFPEKVQQDMERQIRELR